MAEFICTLCGRCCMGMGKYVKISGQIGQGRYAAHHGLSNETFYPSIMREYRDTFSPYDRKTPKEWCPFLLDADESGKYICVIHDSLPSFCRNFKCYLFKIYNSDNIYVGEVKGKTTLISNDEILNKMWNDEISNISTENMSLWRKSMISALEKKGYFVVDYE